MRPVDRRFRKRGVHPLRAELVRQRHRILSEGQLQNLKSVSCNVVVSIATQICKSVADELLLIAGHFLLFTRKYVFAPPQIFVQHDDDPGFMRTVSLFACKYFLGFSTVTFRQALAVQQGSGSKDSTRQASAAGNGKKSSALSVHDNVSWELSSTYFALAQRLQDHAPLHIKTQEEIERQVGVTRRYEFFSSDFFLLKKNFSDLFFKNKYGLASINWHNTTAVIRKAFLLF